MTEKRSKKISKKRFSRRNKTQEGGSQEIISAVSTNKMNIIINFLKNGGNVNYMNNNGYTLLHVACMHGNLDIMRLLLAHGANVNQPGSNYSPLYEAAIRGHFEMVEELLNRGADPTWVDMYGRSLILNVNTKTGNQEMVKLLIRKGIINGYTRGDAERDGVLEQYQQQINMERIAASLIAEKYNLPGDVADYVILPYISREPTQPGGKRKTKRSKAKKGSKKRVSRRNKNKK